MKNEITVGDVLMCQEEILNNLAFISKELPKLNIPTEISEAVTSATDKYLSGIFDIRNSVAAFAEHIGTIVIDPLLEEIVPSTATEAAQAIQKHLDLETEALCSMVDSVQTQEVDEHQYPDMSGLRILIQESTGNIILLSLKLKSALLGLILLHFNLQQK